MPSLEPLEIRVEADTTKADKDIQIFARDTGKRIDQVRLIKLKADSSELSIALFKAQQEFNKLKKVAREVPDAFDDAKFAASFKKAEGSVKDLRSELTESNRKINNLKNTGDEATSRLKVKFDSVTESIEDSRKELKKFELGARTLKKLESQLESINKDFKAGAITAQQYGKSLKSIKDKTEIAAKKTRELKNNIKTLVGVAGGLAVLDKAQEYVLQMDRSMTKLAVSTGATEVELEAFRSSARKLQSEGFGDFSANIEALALVKRQLKITGLEAENTAKSALLLEQGFGIGTKEGIDAMDKAMKGFNVTQKEASDILVSGLQQSGDASGDFIDTVREYASQVGEAGGEFDEFINKILVAEELGIRNTDQFADLYRESIIRVKEDSDKTREGFEDLGLSFDDFAEKLADGSTTVEEQIGIIASKILEVKDPIKQNQIAVDLLGTKYEDNGLVAVKALASTEKKIGDVVGTTEEASKKIEESLGGTWGKVQAKTLPFFDHMSESLGQLILKMIEVGSDILSVIGGTFTVLTSVVPKAITQMMLFVRNNFGKGLDQIGSDISNTFTSMATSALLWGSNLVGSFIDGLKSQFPKLTGVVAGAAKIVTDFLAVFSPTKKGPLAQDQSKWGENLITAINSGIQAKKADTEKAMKEIADVIGKPIDSPEVRGVFEGLQKEKQDLLDLEEEQTKKIIEAQNKKAVSIKENADAVGDLREEYRDLRDDAIKSLQAINQELKELDSDEDNSLAERRLEILKEQKDIQDDIQGVRDSDDTDKAQQIRDLRAEETALAQELELINSNVTAETIKQVEAYDKLNESEKILADNQKKRQELQQQSLLQTALSQGRDIQVEQDDENGIKAFVENEKGELIELTNFKVAQDAVDADNQRTALQTKELALLESIATESAALQASYEQKGKARNQSHTFILRGK